MIGCGTRPEIIRLAAVMKRCREYFDTCIVYYNQNWDAEVVSDMEYELAKRLGYEADRIVYNGPYKGAVLEDHLLAGGINNIDRVEEAHRICEIADKNPDMSLRTGIRVNFDVDAGYTSRFGVDIDKIGQILELLATHSLMLHG